jgi:large subunit ribosomal protein L17
LLLHERIVTTEAKAKELRRIAEQMITLAKREDLHARRQASRIIMDESVLKKLFDSLGARFSQRLGGYTRITKLSYRAGDGAPLAAIELLDQVKEKSETPARGKTKKSLRKPKASKKESAQEKPEAKEAKGEKEKKGKPAEGKRGARPPKTEKRQRPAEQNGGQA